MTLPEQIKELQAFVDQGGAYLTGTVYPPRILDIVIEIHKVLQAHGRTLEEIRKASASLHGAVPAQGRRPRKKQAEKSVPQEGDKRRADDAFALRPGA